MSEQDVAGPNGDDFVNNPALSTLREALTYVAIPSVLANPSGTFIWVNTAACELFGRTSEELLHTTWRDITHPDDLERDNSLVAALIDGQQDSFHQRKRYVRPAGDIAWADSTVSAIRRDGILLGFLGQLIDVDAEVRATEELEKSQARLSSALMAELEGHQILDAVRDSTGAIVDFIFREANPVACETFGLEPKEILGRRISDVSPESFSSGRLEQYIHVVETGEPIEWQALPVHTERIGPGRYFDARIIKSGDGVSFAFRDVTERVTLTKELQESELRYRLVAENTSDAVFVANTEGHLTYASPSVQELTGFKVEDFLGRTPLDFAHPDDHDTLIRVITEVSQGERRNFRARFRRADGSYRWMDVNSSPIVADDGSVMGRVAAWKDIQNEVEYEETLEEERTFLRSILDSQLDPHVTLRAIRDTTGQIIDFEFIDANVATLVYFGMSETDLLGQRLTHMFPSDAGRYLREIYATVVETGDPYVEDDYEYPNEIFGGDVRRYDIRATAISNGLSLTWRDVTARSEMTAALTESEERFRLLAENSTDVVTLFDGGSFSWVSPSITTQLGWQPDDWERKDASAFVHPDDLKVAVSSAMNVNQGSRDISRVRVLDSSGEYRWIEVHSGPFINDDDQITGIVASFRVIDEEVRLEELRDTLARTDPVTGLINRHEAFRILTELLEDSSNQQRVGVLFCDVDKFKTINDEFGHTFGDHVLRTIGQRIAALLGPGDVSARLGGDELLILVTHAQTMDALVDFAECIRVSIQEPISHQDSIIHASLSIGVAIATHRDTVDSLIERADTAMYMAKKSGRNTVMSIV